MAKKKTAPDEPVKQPEGETIFGEWWSKEDLKRLQAARDFLAGLHGSLVAIFIAQAVIVVLLALILWRQW